MAASDRNDTWAILGAEHVASLFADASVPWWIAGGPLSVNRPDLS